MEIKSEGETANQKISTKSERSLKREKIKENHYQQTQTNFYTWKNQNDVPSYERSLWKSVKIK